MASIPGASSRWTIRCRLFAASAGRRLFQAMCSAAGILPFPLYWHGSRQHSISAAVFRNSFLDISGIGEPPPGLGVRRRDVDNIQKPVLDALQHAGVYHDDFQIVSLCTDRLEPREGGQLVVTVTRVTDLPNQNDPDLHLESR